MSIKSSMNIKAVRKNLIIDLLRNNICKFCILRFLNEKNPDFYHKVDIRINKLLEEEIPEDSPDVKKIKQNPCSTCLGLLQNSNDSEFISKVVNEVKKQNYDSDDVTFALELPVALLLRNRSLWLYLSNKYLDFFLEKSESLEIKQEQLVVSLKEVWKWLCAQKIAEKLNKTVCNGVIGNFHVNIVTEYEEGESEISCLFEMFPNEFKNRGNRKKEFQNELLTRKKVDSMLLKADADMFKGHYSIPPEIPASFIKCSSIECYHDNIYIAGRYNKLSRNLSQTIWMINGERKLDTSIEEIIEKPISKAIPNGGVKFSSSGREDVDVRTLGRGRPFLISIINPLKTKINSVAVREIEKEINDSTEDIYVRDLQIVPKEDIHHIKSGEENKSKTYTCFCFLKLNSSEEIPEFKEKLEKLSEIKDLVINQKTPIRVLHRRSLAVRPKTIYWLKAQFHEVRNNHLFFKLSLRVGAGTYIKEFIHGDFGRTVPNLCEILNRETDILALDVEEVALNWPPYLNYDDNNVK